MKTITMAWRTSLLRRLRPAAALLAAAVAVGCGGGVGEEGTGIRTESASVGVLQGLSDTTVTVNGVEYRRQATRVSDGLGEPLPESALRLGMWIEVNGSVALDGSDAEAREIRVRAAARGVIKGIQPDGTLTVLDSPVTLKADTVLDGGASGAGLAPGDLVEVHGPLGAPAIATSSAAAGAMTASRIERLTSSPSVPVRYELRGRVSQIDPIARTMRVGGRQVDYNNARVVVGLALKTGQTVRVSSSAAPADGTAWTVDDLLSDVTLPANLGFLYTEGFVDQWQPGPVFQLEDLRVDATVANGQARITADGLRVAVFGARVDGTLKAKAVAVVEPGDPVTFTLVGPVSNFVSPASFRVRGVPVDASAATFVAPAIEAALADTVRVRVEGTVRGRGLALTKVALVLP